MLILGIETSCDETSAAVVEETGDASKPWAVRSNIVASQVAIHREWGGVVPELASRQHIRDICGVVERSLEEAKAAWSDLGAVAVTQGPGLVGSLLVGVSFAKSVAAASGLPLVAVHHLAGHIESLVLQNGELPLPAIVLVVSGGHTSLYLVETPGHYALLSRTRDDAAGEAYDKVAKLLGLGYPGGPVIDRLARTGNDRAVQLPTTRLTHADRNAPELKGDLDFSFSGLKTAVLRHVRNERECAVRAGDRGHLRQFSARGGDRPARSAVRCRAALSGEERRHRRGGIRQQPPARRARGPRPAARDAHVPPQSGPVNRQRGDDRSGGASEVPCRRDGVDGSQRRRRAGPMIVVTDYLVFNTKKRQEFLRITDEIAAIVKRSGVKEGTVLVSAMHITSGVYVNDWEDGLIHDFQVWLEKLAPAGLDYRHHQTGEDNADAHLKRTIMGHQVVLPITDGALDLGPWEQVFYAEFDGQRKKRVVVKVMGV